MTTLKWALLVVFLLLDAAAYRVWFQHRDIPWPVTRFNLLYGRGSYPATYTSGTLKYFKKGTNVDLVVDRHWLRITHGYTVTYVPGDLVTGMKYADGKLALSWGKGYLQRGDATFECKEDAVQSIEHATGLTAIE